MTIGAGLLTVGRFIIHWRKNRKHGSDDYFNALALVFLLAFIILFEIYVPIEYNAILYSKGLSNRPPTQVEAVRDMKLNIAGIVLFFCTIYSVKASFLALYWQIFQISKRFRLAWFCLAVYTILSFVVSFITVFTRCGPANYFANLGKFQLLSILYSHIAYILMQTRKVQSAVAVSLCGIPDIMVSTECAWRSYA
jgi:hypothetical protein